MAETTSNAVEVYEILICLAFCHLLYVCILQNIVRIRSSDTWFWESFNLRTSVQILSVPICLFCALDGVNFISMNITDKMFIFDTLRLISSYLIILIQIIGLKFFLQTINLVSEEIAQKFNKVVLGIFCVYSCCCLIGIILTSFDQTSTLLLIQCKCI